MTEEFVNYNKLCQNLMLIKKHLKKLFENKKSDFLIPGYSVLIRGEKASVFREFCKNQCKLGSSCSYMVAGMPFLRKGSKRRKASYIKGFRVLENAGCSFVVAPSAAKSSIKSVTASPFDCRYAAVKGTPAAF